MSEDQAQTQTDITDRKGDSPDAPPPNKGNPIKEMFLLAALYLPMGFFLWFFASSLLMLPTRLVVEWLLVGVHGDFFVSLFQDGYVFEVQANHLVRNPETGQMIPLTWLINPMIYAWGMALLFGLVMATPLTIKRRLVQLLIGFVVVSGVAVWGSYWEAWRDLAFLFGPGAGALINDTWHTPTMIALFYQMGYLMFPAVIPVATWILMNRDFIEREVLKGRR
ncbi:MAG: exosortase H-associated membrane protein [Wenzhouxiangella sp.]